MRFFAPLPFRFGVTTHFLTRAQRRRSRASARTRRPRRRTSLTSGASSPSSRNRRCAPTARGGYPRVRGGPHLAGACPDGRGNNTLENPGLTACVATFPNEPRLVTSRRAASHGSPALALDPADARFPANPPHDTPHRFARALERLPAQRARAVAVRATYTGASRARSRSSFRRSRRFFRSDVRFLETATHTLALLISRIFLLATKEPLFSSLFPFFQKRKKHPSSRAPTDGRPRAATNDMSALTLFTRCRLFLFRLPRTTTT